MIKKIIFSFIFIYFSFNTNAQFLRGIGVFIGGTSSSHLYVNSLPLDSIRHTFPVQSHRSAERLSWSVGVLGEFLRYNRIRWQTEFEYCNKGAIENPFTTWDPPTRSGKTTNKFAYLQWNNYAKIFLNEGYRGTPYVMLGARLEYNISRSITAFSSVLDKAPKITVTPDVAIGYEFVFYSKFKPFVELHYNPDVLKIKVDPVTQRGRMFELRIGVIYRLVKSIDDCNAPRYHGSNY